MNSVVIFVCVIQVVVLLYGIMSWKIRAVGCARASADLLQLARAQTVQSGVRLLETLVDLTMGDCFEKDGLIWN